MSLHIFWSTIALSSGVLLVLRLRREHQLLSRSPRLVRSTPYGLWIVITLLITLFIAATCVPNNWDAMTYHLPNVEHWLQNGSLAFYPTHDSRQNDLGPLAEIIILQWRAITGGHDLSQLPQWLAMAGSLVGSSQLLSHFE